jgi:hypothetical protein
MKEQQMGERTRERLAAYKDCLAEYKQPMGKL